LFEGGEDVSAILASEEFERLTLAFHVCSVTADWRKVWRRVAGGVMVATVGGSVAWLENCVFRPNSTIPLSPLKFRGAIAKPDSAGYKG